MIPHPTSDELKACSEIVFCAWSKTGGSRLVFPTLTLVLAIGLQAAARRNNSSSFQIQPSISRFDPQALSSSLRKFHWKSARFTELQRGQSPMN